MSRPPKKKAAPAPDERTQDELLAYWSAHPWNWLTARDPFTKTGKGLGPGYDLLDFPDGRPLIWTTDEREQNPRLAIKPFPNKAYLFQYYELLMRERLLLIDKCRQMYFSTATLLYHDWMCRFQLGRLCVLSKRTEDEAIKMLTEKTRRVHMRLPEWVQDALPLKDKPRHILQYTRTQSDTYAANELMAEGLARGGTASSVFIDEGGYQPHTGSILAAALPMAAQIILCSTANIASAGGRAMKAIIDSVVDEGVVATP